MYPRHRIDIRPGDLAFAAVACARPWRRERLERAIEELVAPPDDALACLSVRSAFDLLLGALDLPAGSEVLVSAITHPDMVGILELHGLTPVPVDLDLETLAPSPELAEELVSERTRMLLVAPLFGCGVDLAPLAAVASRHGLLLVEDLAQDLREPGLAGSPHADVSLFSFGPIKTATALGGAVARVRDDGLRARMRAALAAWPLQPRRELLARTARFALLAALARPAAYGAFVRACRRRGRDLDELLSSFVRGFRVPYHDPAFAARIRRRPSAPLLALLRRRLATFDRERLARRAALGERLASALPQELFHPGRRAPVRTHWVFPVVAGDPGRLLAEVRRQGLDAAPARATSAIVA
ncbi:MAG TPA: DegT/DnrJ/EryC1/StrS family aminotransferase, partial [Gaiellaceae bacterium]|nr:DegT/DnrJ/EryC1/StrS family aminotransferase [Gaiellaceae bacterium]